MSPRDRSSFHHTGRGQGTLTWLKLGQRGEDTGGLAFLQDAPVQGEQGKGTPGVLPQRTGTSKRMLFRGGEKTQGEGCWGQERIRKAKRSRTK